MIRFFEPSDINGLVRLARYHSKELEQDGVLPIDDVYLTRNLRKMLMDSSVQCIVVEKNDEIIGYAIFYLHTKLWNPTLFGQLAFFYILEGERNKYIADQLWSEIIAVCKKNGAQFFESDICAFNNEWQGSDNAINRASTYFEHKNGDHCGNHYIHRISA